MRFLFKLVLFLWLLPVTIPVWLFYIFPLLALGEIRYEGKADAFVWVFENTISDSWYDQRWSRWAGWSGPCVFIYLKYDNRKYPSLTNKELHLFNEKTKAHELRHCQQQFWFGPFFYFLYSIESLRVWLGNLFLPTHKKKSPYLSNRFEVDARKAAERFIANNKGVFHD